MSAPINTKKLGRQAEDLVCRYLQKQKLKLVARNYSCRYGEIDLIMRDKTSLVFIEVRYRQNPYFGSSLETINWTKQNKVIKTAEYYLLTHHLSEKTACRFDVVGVKPSVLDLQQTVSISKLSRAQVEWIKNAFSR
jgi:putative endonuclease